ncbi:TnsA-like heteromeric transposase endonuclease subunit [Tsukamurella asaccharolytica]|uniref:TnsA-like heteromeric transposase endonuclease subunit n=1 Tax=Tsukamurella asaccharolytica TaxID=2592067 RepID=A0A5C5R5Q4_9ACTN|nr:TnsA-like heteromeric transposase endonuclease subunit [Tsukamurella asaccharolytica]
MPPGDNSGPAVEVTYRRGADGCARTTDFATASSVELNGADPWRTFRWYYGQKHYSGWYWASTTQRLVIYESRLELANLLLADFDADVRGIAAQPFRLTTEVDGKVRSHVPDYLLDTESGPVVVDVKPARLADKENVAATLAWTRHVVEARGWRYTVATEPPTTRLTNVRFLAGFRDPRHFAPEAIEQVLRQAVTGRTIADTLRGIDAPAHSLRATLFHLIWTQQLRVDIDAHLTGRSQITEVR